MIRFVDLRSADIAGNRFAFFDTVPDLFVELHDEQAFDTWADFEELFKGSGYLDLERFRGLCPEWVFLPEPIGEDIGPRGTIWECGRCAQLHDGVQGEAIPEHSPRCPMREERAAAWDAGYRVGKGDGIKGVKTGRMFQNPHR
jgi:hypothetical protein